jgi:hypothetical protein
VERLPPVWEYVQRLRKLWDENLPSDVLNHPTLREAAKALVKGSGGGTRPDQVAQALVFAAELERERMKALVSLATWPCHDHPPSNSSIEELFARSIAEEPLIERARGTAGG